MVSQTLAVARFVDLVNPLGWHGVLTTRLKKSRVHENHNSPIFRRADNASGSLNRFGHSRVRIGIIKATAVFGVKVFAHFFANG